MLSPGEQQRIAFARVLLTKPKAVFLDEATSALDEGLEFALYQLVRTELPNTILVSVSHRSTVEQHHTHDSNCSATASGGWAAWKTNPSRFSAPRRASRRGGRRTSPPPAGCRWRSPCRPGRCWTRRHPRRTGRGSRCRPRAAPHRRWTVARPPTVNPEYIALPSDRSKAPHGPLSWGARNSGCLWKSGSSPLAACSL